MDPVRGNSPVGMQGGQRLTRKASDASDGVKNSGARSPDRGGTSSFQDSPITRSLVLDIGASSTNTAANVCALRRSLYTRRLEDRRFETPQEVLDAAPDEADTFVGSFPTRWNHVDDEELKAGFNKAAQHLRKNKYDTKNAIKLFPKDTIVELSSAGNGRHGYVYHMKVNGDDRAYAFKVFIDKNEGDYRFCPYDPKKPGSHGEAMEINTALYMNARGMPDSPDFYFGDPRPDNAHMTTNFCYLDGEKKPEDVEEDTPRQPFGYNWIQDTESDGIMAKYTGGITPVDHVADEGGHGSLCNYDPTYGFFDVGRMELYSKILGSDDETRKEYREFLKLPPDERIRAYRNNEVPHGVKRAISDTLNAKKRYESFYSALSTPEHRELMPGYYNKFSKDEERVYGFIKEKEAPSERK